MKEKIGEVFSISADNEPVSGCTIAKEVHGGANAVTYFSLAKNTDISAEIYPYHKFLLLADGNMDVYGAGEMSKKSLAGGDCILTEADTKVGMRTSGGTIYTEIEIRKRGIVL